MRGCGTERALATFAGPECRAVIRPCGPSSAFSGTMGRHDVQRATAPEARRSFTRAILRDIQALEHLLAAGMIETGVRRIGAEQELFLTDRSGRPAPIAMELLGSLRDGRFTTEIARFNIEANLDPIEVDGAALSTLHAALTDVVSTARIAAARHSANIVLTGILPTLTRADLTPAHLTPGQRYAALNEAVMENAGGRIRLRIQGPDELLVEHDSVVLEGCNTSFQVHLQVDPAAFIATYNAAQALAGPILAACVNSPMLFGRRLWAETRIALFQQSIDTRTHADHPREQLPRVWFGDAWQRGSIVEIFRENLTRHRLLLVAETDEDPVERILSGDVPALEALQLHNGTVYRWNRPCYGVLHGRPHLRIECRMIPSGPTVVDEVANAALWIGAVSAGASAFDPIGDRMRFDDARGNFVAAARLGLDAGFTWLGGERLSASGLLLDRLLPLARQGLVDLGIAEHDIDRYLGIIEQRVATGQTGASWLVRSDQALRDCAPRAACLSSITWTLADRAASDLPVHEWPLLTAREMDEHPACYERVEDCMTADLLTVHEDDAVDLVAFLMHQRPLRQILVEDAAQRLVGIISWRSLLRMLATGRLDAIDRTIPVREIMERDVVTVPIGTLTADAIRLMRERDVTALPVLDNGRLVGIVTEHDFLPVLAGLLRQTPASGEAERTRSESAAETRA